MLRALTSLFLLCLVPALALADEDHFVYGHEGQTVAEVNGEIKWLDDDQIAGVPWWEVRVKCFKGNQVAGETQMQVWDGYTGQSEGSGTRGYWNPFTGRTREKTRINYFMYFDSRHPDPNLIAGQDPGYQDVLSQVQAFALGPATLYVYSEGADRFEAELYSSHTPGYTLDRSRVVPVATQNDDAPLILAARLSGPLTPHEKPLFVERPVMPFTENGKQGLMVCRPDGSYEFVDPTQSAFVKKVEEDK